MVIKICVNLNVWGFCFLEKRANFNPIPRKLTQVGHFATMNNLTKFKVMLSYTFQYAGKTQIWTGAARRTHIRISTDMFSFTPHTRT